MSVLVDLSPLCVGHLLVVSDDHYVSFAEVVDRYAPDVVELLQEILPKYSAAFGEVVVFEHGSSQKMESASCITHAHWHLLPLRFDDLDRVLADDGLPMTELGRVENLSESVTGGLPYFYLADQDNCRLYGLGVPMPKQYLRSVAGRVLGISDPEWDWAVVVRKAELRRTLEIVAGWGSGLGEIHSTEK